MEKLTVVSHEVCIDIGGMPILVRTESSEFRAILEDRYGGFVAPPRPDALNPNEPPDEVRHTEPVFELEVELIRPGIVTDAEDARVRREGRRWVMERGDFRAEWDPERRQGWVRQAANPYSIDAVLRILHSLILAREGGFLVHAASAIRNGRAFLFAGFSGAGKTTISRLAPPDVALLTDEISYVRPGQATGKQDLPVPRNLSPVTYHAFGTPFAGELARIGENLRAPVAALYLLAQGPKNRIEPVKEGDAARALLQNVLFFAQDDELVRLVFESVFDFVSRVPVRKLVFAPDTRVWELIT